MTEEREERILAAFERIAAALAGINETKRHEFARRWPEPRERREAVVTRIPNEDDLIREAHGASDESLAEWLNPPVDEEIIGTREREWRRTHPEAYPGNHPSGAAGAQAVQEGDQTDGGGAEAPQSQD